jgi:hypothetical protein
MSLKCASMERNGVPLPSFYLTFPHKICSERRDSVDTESSSQAPVFNSVFSFISVPLLVPVLHYYFFGALGVPVHEIFHTS